jgi:tetratricopeptide (TPR) repeat protein
MDKTRIDSLMEALKSSDEAVREQATETLWRIWFDQKGAVGFEALQRSQQLLQVGEIAQAAAILGHIIQTMPDFAEAWNRRAVLYFVQRQYRRAISDCQEALRLNPRHFGALHGMGLCYQCLGEYSQAIYTFRQALELQPFSIENQRLLLECTANLS